MTGSKRENPRHGRAWTGAAFALLAISTIVGATESADGHKWKAARARPELARSSPCPAPPGQLGVARHATFAYRIQQPYDVERLARMRAHRRSSLPKKDRDIFLVRARGSQARQATETISRLKNTSLLSGQLFVCNRIVTLTGVRTDGARPNEDVYNQAGNWRVWGIFPDWERPLWRHSYPRRPQWSNRFATNLRRIRSRSSGIRGRGKYAGVVVTGWRYRGPNAWNYGRLVKGAYLDGQIIQTQSECQMSPDRFRHRARRLRAQYRGAGVGRSKLAMQVSFARNPGGTRLPHDVTPQRAAQCTRAAYAAGVRTFLLWASPPYLDEYFRALPDYIRR